MRLLGRTILRELLVTALLGGVDFLDFEIKLRLTLGPGRCTFYTCDLTYEYVKLNADYTT